MIQGPLAPVKEKVEVLGAEWRGGWTAPSCITSVARVSALGTSMSKPVKSGAGVLAGWAKHLSGVAAGTRHANQSGPAPVSARFARHHVPSRGPVVSSRFRHQALRVSQFPPSLPWCAQRTFGRPPPLFTLAVKEERRGRLRRSVLDRQGIMVRPPKRASARRCAASQT